MCALSQENTQLGPDLIRSITTLFLNVFSIFQVDSSQLLTLVASAYPQGLYGALRFYLTTLLNFVQFYTMTDWW